jgi:hypothetical protein
MTANLEILVVGRTHQGSQLDIEIPSRNDSVGRRHLEITIGDGGACHLVDLGSANGTHVLDGTRWVRVKQTTVGISSPIRLGEFQTSVAELLGMRRPATAPQPPPISKPPPVPGAKPRRNPLTGEIE